MLYWAWALFSFLWSPVRVWYLGEAAADQAVVRDALAQLPRALLVLVGTVAMSGAFLYIAAWYEATTLILFR